MTHTGKALASVFGCLLLTSSLYAITADNPYQGIVDRNVFGLKAPPAPVDPTELNKPQPPKITLTGITTILGNKRVLFKIQQPARPPEPAKEQSFIMTEGQREGQIEVMEIDVKAGAIKFNNYGSVMTLTMEKDGAKLPNTPPAAAGAPPTAVGFAPQPGQQPNPGVTGFGGGAPGFKSIPERTVRSPGANNNNNPGLSTGYPAGAGIVQQQQQPQYSPEEATLMMEVERQRLKNRGDGLADLMPPTELTPSPNSPAPTLPGPTTTPRHTVPRAPSLPPLPQ
jgi:hypothetical protein